MDIQFQSYCTKSVVLNHSSTLGTLFKNTIPRLCHRSRTQMLQGIDGFCLFLLLLLFICLFVCLLKDPWVSLEQNVEPGFKITALDECFFF